MVEDVIGCALEGTGFVIAAKDAPEAVADLCHFNEARQKELTAALTRMADDGLRVLGVAGS